MKHSKHDRIDELLDIAYENNKLLKDNSRMLKQIIGYINYISANHHNDNEGEFMRNIFANMISNIFPFNRK